MSTCPKCKTENRPGAKFCAGCGNTLAGVKTKPIAPATSGLAKGNGKTQKRPERKVRPSQISTPQPDTTPINSEVAFEPRPSGAIFGEQFLYEQLIFSEQGKNEYLVSQFGVPQNRRIRKCSNQSCGAVYSSPGAESQDIYCTDCQGMLGTDLPDLILREQAVPYSEAIALIAQQPLPQTGVRAPLAVFDERVGRAERHCIVAPYTQTLVIPSETEGVLRWGIVLGDALSFLHDNGIFFKGQIDWRRFGMEAGHPVWVDFQECEIAGEAPELEQVRDVRALAMQLFSWATGEEQYVPAAAMLPSVKELFTAALEGDGFRSGTELVGAIESALEQLASQIAVDFRVGRRSHVGIQRQINEDSLLTIESCQISQYGSKPVGVFVVADGLGGHAAGEKASSTAVGMIAESAHHVLASFADQEISQADILKWLADVTQEVNQAVFNLRKAAGTDMGTTLVAAVLKGEKAHIAHIGDSRAYVIGDNGIHRITTDHSLVERLIASQQITREEARTHSQRNVVYRTVGDKPKVDVDTTVHRFSTGEWLLLCSDGLSGMVEDSVIQDIVLGARDSQEACDALVNAANAAGGDDNVTVILVKIVKA